MESFIHVLIQEKGIIYHEIPSIKCIREKHDARIVFFAKFFGWEDGRCGKLSGMEVYLGELSKQLSIFASPRLMLQKALSYLMHFSKRRRKEVKNTDKFLHVLLRAIYHRIVQFHLRHRGHIQVLLMQVIHY